MTFPLPDNEAARLAALRDLDIVDSPNTAEFDAVVEAVADLFDCPIAVISFIEENEQWFKANVGLDTDRMPKEVAICAHTIVADDLLVVRDLTADDRFKDNPLVTDDLQIRFYAGCPLSIDGKHRLGSLCVVDTKPREATDLQLRQLRRLGTAVEGLIRAHQSAVAQESKIRNHASLLEQVANVSGVGGWELDLADLQPVWTIETKRIHEVPDDYVPSLETAIQFYAPEARPIIKKAVETGIATGKGWDLELPFITGKGRKTWIRAVGQPMMENGKVRRIVGAIQDISERKEIERKRWESERLAREKSAELEVTLANMKQGVSVFDGDGKLVLWNQQYIDIFQKPPEEIFQGVSFYDVIEAEKQREEFEGDVTEMVDGLRQQLANGETVCNQIRLKSGRVVAVTQAPMPDGGWVGTHDDITAQEQASARILHAAQHDILTGLANRSLFNMEMEKAVNAARAGDREQALMLVDLDRFKQVNDTFGHNAGDELLKASAQRLSACVKAGDVVARLGGDEFAIILRDVPEERDQLARLASRLVERLSAPFGVDANRIEIGASIGIALIPRMEGDVETVLTQADSALYKVKQTGKSGFRFFDAEIQAEVSTRRRREVSLREAVRTSDFELHYQPIVSLTDGTLVGHEALIRWPRPSKPPVPPSEFIPIAEETGLILEVGTWVLNTALREAVNWPGQTKVALNISPKQLGHGRLVREVAETLGRWKVDPKQLQLEVTENILIQNDEATFDELYKLKELGVGIVLDDFGTGYSSLSYLHRFPFDKLKIDRSFVADLEGDAQCAAIVCAIANLANSLGMDSTAEGIETDTQLSLLQLAGCTNGQGYYIGRPVPAPKIDNLPMPEIVGVLKTGT